MLFSVIVPVYRVEEYLPQCVESVLGQTCPDFQLILVDDGSPDRCGEICDRYGEQDSRVTVLHKENGGLSDARNAGLEAAQGEYVLFLDSDDWLDPGALAGFAEVIRGNEAAPASSVAPVSRPDVVFGHFVYVYPEPDGSADSRSPSSTLRREAVRGQDREAVFRYLFTEYPDTIWSACRSAFRRDLLEREGLRFRKGILCEDAEFTPRVLLAAETFDVYEPPYYFYRRLVETSITHDDNPKRELDLLEVMESHCAWVEALPEGEQKAAGRWLAEYLADYYAKVLLGSEHLYRGEDRKRVRRAVKDRLYLLEKTAGKKARLIRAAVRTTGYAGGSRLVWAIWRLKLRRRRSGGGGQRG